MDKQQKIIEMFNDISKSYDLANRVLSLGIDITWRKIACKKAYANIDKKSNIDIADIACGTGDMILFWEKMAKVENVAIGDVVGVDPSVGMLEVAREKLPHVRFIESEAKEISLEDSSRDIISISYGIRNVVERVKALSEFHRILREGGILVILEFTKSENETLLDKFVSFYTKKILPIIGGLVSKNYKAYKYLPDSIEEFLTSDMLLDELDKVGFDKVYVKSYSGNISTLFIMKKRAS